MTIYKFLIGMGRTNLTLPKDTRIVHVAELNRQICLWIFLDSIKEFDAQRSFHVYGTGAIIPEELTYVGTVIIEQWAWHVFEVISDV